jgi:hypothetical protein
MRCIPCASSSPAAACLLSSPPHWPAATCVSVFQWAMNTTTIVTMISNAISTSYVRRNGMVHEKEKRSSDPLWDLGKFLLWMAFLTCKMGRYLSPLVFAMRLGAVAPSGRSANLGNFFMLWVLNKQNKWMSETTFLEQQRKPDILKETFV